MRRYYICDKDNNEKIYGYIDYNHLTGFKVKPRNNIKYEGIEVSRLTLVKPNFIENILRKKTRRKLEAYLAFLINILEDDDTDPENLSLVIEDVNRYKNIIINKYSKFLPKHYIEKLLTRVNYIEEQLKEKIDEYTIYKAQSKGKGR